MLPANRARPRAGFLQRAIPAALLALAMAPASLLAATQTLTGTRFDVVFDDAAIGLYGPLLLAGDSIVFSPIAFAANSENGAGQATLDRTVELQLLPHAGQVISAVGLIERGTYRLAGAQSDVYASGELRVSGVLNAAPQVADALVPDTFFGFTGGATQAWQGTAAVSLLGSGIAQDGGVRLSLQTILEGKTRVTDTSALRVAYIGLDPTGAAITLNVTMVPEPESWAMLLTGLAAIGALARRRRHAVA